MQTAYKNLRSISWQRNRRGLIGTLILLACLVSLARDDATGADAAKHSDAIAVTDFWSFRELSRPQPPTLAETASPLASAIDKFILAELEKKGIKPNQEADRRTLIRRAYFDLVGLPPTYEEVVAFVNDNDIDAYEKLIDRLLSSPQYGERWGRHWLDVRSYADSMGFEHDFDRPYAFRYRDYVIRALNEDMPFDQFMKWQIAGDEIAPTDRQALAATAFLTVGAFPTTITEAEFERARYDQLDDMASTTSVAFLGLTVGCARCHDHKFDPITSRDYYRILSTFTSTIIGEVKMPSETSSEGSAEYQGELERCEEQLAWFETHRLPAMLSRHLEQAPDDDAIKQLVNAGKRDEALKRLAADQPLWNKFSKELEGLKARKPTSEITIQVSTEGLPKLWHDANERGFPHFFEHTYLLRRGDVNHKADEVAPGFLPALTRSGVSEEHWQQPPPLDRERVTVAGH